VASIALGLAPPAAATVAPPTPEQIVMSQKREALENSARSAFGDVGLMERLRDWRKTWGYILIGQEDSPRPARLMVKDEFGWYEMRPGRDPESVPRTHA
jgi:hypothetical protein